MVAIISSRFFKAFDFKDYPPARAGSARLPQQDAPILDCRFRARLLRRAKTFPRWFPLAHRLGGPFQNGARCKSNSSFQKVSALPREDSIAGPRLFAASLRKLRERFSRSVV